MELQLLENHSYVYIGRNGTVESRREDVLAEHSVDICVNGILMGKVTCIPEHLELLAWGRLLTEGIISSAEDVSQLAVSESGDCIQVTLRGKASAELTPVEPIPWKSEWIFNLADCFAAGTPLHEKTWATHSCILARDGEVLFSCEDLGRHNALDKVIGYGLTQGIPLNRCTIYSSGRIPTDMASKAIRAGIPILVSKASPTAAAVRLARRCKLTLICAARKDRMKLFSGDPV